MGQGLPKAVTSIALESDVRPLGLRVCHWRSEFNASRRVVEPEAGPLFEVGVAEMNGWRPTREDAEPARTAFHTSRDESERHGPERAQQRPFSCHMPLVDAHDT